MRRENKSKIKVGTIVIAPCDSSPFSKQPFEKGAEFKVTGTDEDYSDYYGIGFYTSVGYCLERRCSHIGDMDWIIKEEEEPKQNINNKN